MSWPHYELIQPALDTLSQLGKMLPPGWHLSINAYSDGSMGVSVWCMDSRDDFAYYPDNLPPDDGDYPTPDLIRLVKHVRKLEGLE